MNYKYTVFTDEQIETMRSNPYTLFVSPNQLRFTLEFKERFMELLIAGKTLRGIFLELGYDPDVIGHSRMGNISGRIQKEAKSPEGLHEGNKKRFTKPADGNYDDLPIDEALSRMKHEILYLRQEIQFIKKIIKAEKSD